MEVTYLTAINQALHEEMRRDENVFVMGEDVAELGGAFKVTEGLLDAFGEDRVIDTPISEALIVGAGVGAAILGMRPVVEMQFGDFISCAFDQIVNTAATLRYRHGGRASCPLVVRAPSGAGVHGALFHSQNPEAWFTRVPGLKVVAPATVYDAKGLLKSAIRDENPVIYFEHKRLYRSLKEMLPDGDFTVPIGVAELRQTGRDLSIITYGGTLGQCLSAAQIVGKEDGLSIEILDLRSLLPLDRTAIFATAR
jgi:2-oxoisovalerate dehydrogenase E1 component beta subunit